MAFIRDQIPENAREVLAGLARAGFEAVVVGGFVRDFFLGLDPKDLDIATNARPGQIAELFPQGRILSPSQAFPVVLVQGIEIATFRKDLDCNSRQDVRVEYADSFQEDAQRRDFTVNALGWDDREWKTLDPTGLGLDDLGRKLIRFVGDPQDRLREDPLRAFRAVRFAAKLGFDLELKTRLALIEFSKQLT